MECKHKFQCIGSIDTCILCGLCQGIDLDCINVTYEQQKNITRGTKIYNRKDRFFRLFHNLKGLQEIPCSFMEQIPPDISLSDLKLLLKKVKSFRKYSSKLPSIWRQLGHKLKIITDRELKTACFEFEKIKEKKSFLVVLPHICKKIGRSDLMIYLKIPSEAMQKKYDLFI